MLSPKLHHFLHSLPEKLLRVIQIRYPSGPTPFRLYLHYFIISPHIFPSNPVLRASLARPLLLCKYPFSTGFTICSDISAVSPSLMRLFRFRHPNPPLDFDYFLNIASINVTLFHKFNVN